MTTWLNGRSAPLAAPVRAERVGDTRRRSMALPRACRPPCTPLRGGGGGAEERAPTSTEEHTTLMWPSDTDNRRQGDGQSQVTSKPLRGLNVRNRPRDTRTMSNAAQRAICRERQTEYRCVEGRIDDGEYGGDKQRTRLEGDEIRISGGRVEAHGVKAESARRQRGGSIGCPWAANASHARPMWRDVEGAGGVVA